MAKKKNHPVLKPESSSEEEKQESQQEEPEEAEEEEEEEVSEEEESEEAEEEEEEEEVEEEEEKEEEKEEEEEEEEDSDRDSLRKLLEPFGKDQLLDLLKEAALRNPSVIARISASADTDPIHRKIFVHGLGWDCTTPVLTAAFTPFGDIEDCRVIADRATGRSKGYGFVLFRSRAAARKALKEPQKTIGGRLTSCQLASAGAPKSGSPAAPEPTGRKIFVSNVPDSVSLERLRSFFAKFGEIEEGPLGYDRATGKLRGFAIFVYKTVEGCKMALEEPNKVFEGSQLHCQRAVEGLNKAKTVAAAPFAAMPVAAPGVLQPNDLALTYAPAVMMGMNPLAMNLGMNPAAMNPGSGVGLLNQTARMSPTVNRSGSGITQGAYGVGGASGVNTVSPSIIGSYQSQAALQGLGAYQGNQQNSATASGMSSQSGIGSYGAGFPSYFGR